MDGEISEAIAERFDEAQLVTAPDFFACEVANGLWTHLEHGNLTANAAEDRLAVTLALAGPRARERGAARSAGGRRDPSPSGLRHDVRSAGAPPGAATVITCDARLARALRSMEVQTHFAGMRRRCWRMSLRASRASWLSRPGPLLPLYGQTVAFPINAVPWWRVFPCSSCSLFLPRSPRSCSLRWRGTAPMRRRQGHARRCRWTGPAPSSPHRCSASASTQPAPRRCSSFRRGARSPRYSRGSTRTAKPVRSR